MGVPSVFLLRGFVRVHDQIYLIEPLADVETEAQGARHSSEMHRDGGLHAVYNYKHLRRKRSSCSHGNGTSYYDHVAGPSGLFLLGSLVMMTQSEHCRCEFEACRQKVGRACESDVLFYMTCSIFTVVDDATLVLFRKAEVRAGSVWGNPGRWS